jgi:hypothetical protein
MIERPPVSAAKRLGIAQPALLRPSMHQLAPEFGFRVRYTAGPRRRREDP